MIRTGNELEQRLAAQTRAQYRRAWAISLCLLFVMTAAAIPFSLLGMQTPNVSYQSSDGGWSDAEINTKGRGFRVIRAGFNLYQTHCNPDAHLQRLTRPNVINVFAWPNYLAHPKWDVPTALPYDHNEYTGMVECVIEMPGDREIRYEL